MLKFQTAFLLLLFFFASFFFCIFQIEPFESVFPQKKSVSDEKKILKFCPEDEYKIRLQNEERIVSFYRMQEGSYVRKKREGIQGMSAEFQEIRAPVVTENGQLSLSLFFLIFSAPFLYEILHFIPLLDPSRSFHQLKERFPNFFISFNP